MGGVWWQCGSLVELGWEGVGWHCWCLVELGGVGVGVEIGSRV